MESFAKVYVMEAGAKEEVEKYPSMRVSPGKAGSTNNEKKNSTRGGIGMQGIKRPGTCIVCPHLIQVPHCFLRNRPFPCQ